jgi:hypothetical protein
MEYIKTDDRGWPAVWTICENAESLNDDNRRNLLYVVQQSNQYKNFATTTSSGTGRHDLLFLKLVAKNCVRIYSLWKYSISFLLKRLVASLQKLLINYLSVMANKRIYDI